MKTKKRLTVIFTVLFLSFIGFGLYGCAKKTAPLKSTKKSTLPLETSSAYAALKPGLYKVTMHGKMSMMGGRVLKINNTFNNCVKPHGAKPYMPKSPPAEHCTTSEHSDANGVIHWSMQCTMPNGITKSHGTSMLYPDSFTSHFHSVTTMSVKSLSTTTDIVTRGKRIASKCK
ncbi:MAG: DUF3617 domain-containing protein [bacterium]